MAYSRRSSLHLVSISNLAFLQYCSPQNYARETHPEVHEHEIFVITTQARRVEGGKHQLLIASKA
jgi:hypothetical protein